MPYSNRAGRHLRVLPLPADEYDFAHTSKLITRDVKNIYRTKKTHLVERLKKINKILRTSEPSSTTIAAVSTQGSATLISSPKATVQSRIASLAKSAVSGKAQHAHKVSISTTIETMQPDVFTEPTSRATTAPTIETTKPHYTLYHRLHESLKQWRQDQPFGLTQHESRWMNRGLVLILYIILELCPSNPLYVEMKPHQIELFWAALVVALSDRSSTAKIVEAILLGVLPGLNVDEFLVRIGDPARRFKEGEDDLLRQKLRRLLYPAYGQV